MVKAKIKNFFTSYLDLGKMTFSQGHDTSDHEQPLCQVRASDAFPNTNLRQSQKSLKKIYEWPWTYHLKSGSWHTIFSYKKPLCQVRVSIVSPLQS